MNDAKLEQLIKPLIKTYDSMELRLIKDIAVRLNTYDGIKGSLKWYLDKLRDIGGFHYDSLELLAEYSGKSQREVKKILKYAGYDTSKLDKYKSAIDDKELLNNPTYLYESVTTQNIINSAIRETNSMMDIIRTKALESVEENYMRILTDTYIKVSNGIYSYDTAIRQGLKELAKNGFTGATYKNGKQLSLESAVRRDILTKAHQLAGDIEIDKARNILKTNLVYVTQHLGARTRTKYTVEDYEVHADWQGKVYMLDGSSDKYDNFYEKTGYGELLGLCGVNCRHHVQATKEGWSHPDLIDQEENEKAYLKQQEQRKYERKMRQYKREKEVAKALGDEEELRRINSRYSVFNKKYNKFLEKNNLKRDYSREYIEKDLVKIDDDYISSNKSKLTKQEVSNLMREAKEVMGKEFSDKFKGVKISVSGEKNRSFYRKREDRIYLGNSADRYTVIHELGHKYYYDNKLYKNKIYLKIVEDKFSKYTRNDFRELKGERNYYLLKDYSEFVSEYQTRIYKTILPSFNLKGQPKVLLAKEYFSEGLKYYFKDAGLLVKKDKWLYNFIDEIVKGNG